VPKNDLIILFVHIKNINFLILRIFLMSPNYIIMKIACLYYGHFRNNDQLLSSHLDKIIKNNNCDIFIYTGKHYSNYFTTFPKIINKQNIIINFSPYIKQLKIYEDEIEDVKECQQILSERKKVFESKNKSNFKDHERCLNWLYKLYKCNQMRHEYEQQHNFKYDVIFTFRPDLEIIHQINFNTFNEGFLIIDELRYGMKKESLHGIIDFFIFGTSTQMDLFSNTLFNYYEYDSIDLNKKCNNPDFCYHPVDQIIARMRYNKINFVSTNRNRPVRLMNNISHIPYNEPKPNFAVQIYGKIENTNTNIQNLIDFLIKPNDCDLFICINKNNLIDIQQLNSLIRYCKTNSIQFTNDESDIIMSYDCNKERIEYQQINNKNYNVVILVNINIFLKNLFVINYKLFNTDKKTNITNLILFKSNKIFIGSDYNINILVSEKLNSNELFKYRLTQHELKDMEI